MEGIIHVLPDSVANQIAAGEVVQRPASVVKELMENSIDAGATHIDLIVKNAGRTLIRVTDNGCGMNAEDALRCFERHATSKISSADDLFQLQTKGFRGEALASIASIAHVDLKTRTIDSEVATHLYMEGSQLKGKSECTAPVGTTFEVRNLFFNVPARRNFLKSDNVEFNHILDEFMRIVLTTPNVSFTLYHNDKQIYDLPKTILKQRIINVFGNSYKEKFLAVHQESEVVCIDGFVGKPDAARKTKGEQYLFVNNRYIRHPYFHHAIMSALEEVLPEGYYPSYFIYFEVDPSKIDVNIHPTKIEVKFQEEKVIYSMLRASVRYAVGTFNASSNIDFENISPIDFSRVPTGGIPKPPAISYDPEYNPFNVKPSNVSSKKSYEADPSPFRTQAPDSWRQIYESVKENTYTLEEEDSPELQTSLPLETAPTAEKVTAGQSSFQWQNSYIVTACGTELLVIDQESASERILFERFMHNIERKETVPVQKLLFPESVTFSPQDSETVKELQNEFRDLGFDMEPFGRNAWIIHGVPADLGEENVQRTMEQVLETYKCDQMSLKSGRKTNLARSMARTFCVRRGKKLEEREIVALWKQLSQCDCPSLSPSGKKVWMRFSESDASKWFKDK